MKTKFNGILTLLLAFIVQLSFAQEKTISGTVVDETNMPLPGATVLLSGTTTGTTTDFDGKYTINANTGDDLVFSYVGYADQTIKIATSTTIDVSLQLDNTLETVVVTALGIKRKPDEITSATQLVKGDAINQANNPDAVQALAGKVSGLQINTTSSGVTPSTEIILRGVKSISGTNEALVVIDNIISSAGVLSNLDPSIIESINVLKGPNGAALYGSRGANGVLIVTTKKGSKNGGKFSVQVKSSLTLEDIAYLPELQDRYGKGYWGEIDAFDQGSWGPEYDGSLQPIGLPYPTFNDFRYSTYDFKEDNMEPFFNTGTTFQNSISISGGDQDSYLTLNANKLETKGIIPSDRYNKDFFSLNTGKKIGKLRVSGIARYTSEKSNTVSAYETSGDRTDDSNLYQQLAQLPSDVNIEDFDSGSNDDHWTAFGDSPYWILDNSRRMFKQNTADLSAELAYELNDHINFSVRSSVVNSNYTMLDYVNEYNSLYTITGDSRNISSNLEVETGSSRRLYTDFLANFNYDLTEDISLKSLVGFNLSDRATNSHESFGRNLTIPGFYDVDNISSGIELSEHKTRERSQAIFANVDLGYKDYLFLNLTARNDWSSRLLTQGRQINDLAFFYPSAGISFIPTKAFPELKGKVLHKAKVSTSYVKVGNVGALTPHRISDTGIQGTGFPYATSGLNSFVLPANTTASGIEPEFVSTFEANLNLEFLNRNGIPRVTLDAAASFYTNSNQLLNTSVSSSSGVTQALLNVGETTTNALEVDLGFTPIKTDNLTWSGNIGFSTSKTTVEKVTDNSTSVLTAGTGVPGIYAIEGEEFPLIQGSYYERDDEGRVVLDANGTPQIGSGIKVLGKVTPDYILNFGTQVKYKNFTLNATGDFRTGHVFYSGIYNNLTVHGRSFVTAENGRGAFIFPNSTIEGSGVTNTTVLTGPGFSGPSSYAQYQDYIQGNYTEVDENFILDATAFKVREISLSYSLPEKLLKNTAINNLTLGLSGRNLFTILPKENRGYNDPELAGGIGGYGQTPPTKFYTMSVSLTF